MPKRLTKRKAAAVAVTIDVEKTKKLIDGIFETTHVEANFLKEHFLDLRAYLDAIIAATDYEIKDLKNRAELPNKFYQRNHS